jgi:hypothetical protein
MELLFRFGDLALSPRAEEYPLSSEGYLGRSGILGILHAVTGGLDPPVLR